MSRRRTNPVSDRIRPPRHGESRRHSLPQRSRYVQVYMYLVITELIISCVAWRILHYEPRTQTNNVYAPTPNWNVQVRL